MSTTPEAPVATARVPLRRRGELRVAALLEAAAAVFAERGYAAATMTEIAARAQASIGSLYQFFPNKDVLGAALMQRYLELTVEALATIEARAEALSAEGLAEALLCVFTDLRQERAAAISMFDALPREGQTPFRTTVLAHIVRILKVRRPRPTPARADAMALAVLLQLKSALALESHAADSKAATAALRELRTMLTLYLDAA